MKDNLEEETDQKSQENIEEVKKHMSVGMLKLILFIMVGATNVCHTFFTMLPVLLLFGLANWKIVLVSAICMFIYLMYKTLYNNPVIKMIK